MDNVEMDSRNRNRLRMSFENIHHGDMADDSLNRRENVDSTFPTPTEYYTQQQQMYRAPSEDLRNSTNEYNTYRNSAFEGTSSSEQNTKQDGYGYLKKRDSVLSCAWVPKNPKIFVRRIDGSKRPSKEMIYKLVNGNYNNEKETIPFNSNTREREAFVKEKMEEFEKMPYEYVGANTKNIISTEDSKSLKHNSNSDKESLKDFCVIDNHNPYSNSNVPLCVREMNQAIGRNTSMREFPIQPLIQDEYYFRHVMSQSRSNKCNINLENIIKLFNLLLKCFTKTIQLIFIKMKNEFDPSPVPVMHISSNPLPNMDISCNVCERTDAQRIAQSNQKKDFLSYFESIATNSSLSKYLTKFFDDFETNSKDQLHIYKRDVKEPRAYYQEEAFPKDENGKVVLPKF